jgi:hypothetical protein
MKGLYYLKRNEKRLIVGQNMKTRILALALIVLQWSVCAWAREEEVEYYAVLMEGAKVGYATHSRNVSAGQVRTTEMMDVVISRMGIEMSVRTTETCIETTKGMPLSFMTVQDMGIGSMKTEGTVGKDGVVRVRTSGTGEEQENSFPWPQGAVMAEGLRLMTLKKGLKEGTDYGVKIFSPSLMDAVDSRVKVGAKSEVDLFGRAVVLTKIETAMSMPGTGELTTVSFVDDELKALKSETAMMGMKLELVACEKEVALRGNEYFDVGDNMFLTSPEPIEDVSGARAIAYSLRPTGGAGDFSIPQNDNQRVQKLDDGSVIVVVEPVSVPKGGRFPYRGTEPEIIEATKPSRFLQSDDPKVIALAKQAVGNTKDAIEAAKKIEQFVANYVETRSLSVGYASASEVAASRRGDCSEFAVLCAGMCRAVGIPARVVVGIAYTDDFMGRSGFGGHAWVEAYTGDKWVGLDSAFKAGGKGGFDAGHIAFAWGDGEPARFFNVATTLGRFKIEKVMVNRGY